MKKIQYFKLLILIFLCLTYVTVAYATDVEQIHQEKSSNTTTVESKKDQTKTSETPDELKQLYALSACLMDADNGRVLFKKNANKEMAMASTTKIMTCIVTLENANLKDIVTISSNASRQPDVQLNVREGEQYKLKDLLYSLMLESHNDVAVAIAEHVGNSVEGFAAMMNAKAQELDCKHTSFVTPNGLDAEKHYTTAVELARIAAYAIQNPEFIKITNTSSYTFSEKNKKRSFTVNNKNAFLGLLDGAIGVKTGFTGKAGYCFVGAVKRDGKTFVSVVLACGWPNNKTYKWADTKKIMNYGLNHYEFKDVSKGLKKINPIPVVRGQENLVDLKYKKENIRLLLHKNDTSKIVYDILDTLNAPVYQDQVVGSIRYYINDELYKATIVYAANSVKKIDYIYWLNRICNRWLLQ